MQASYCGNNVSLKDSTKKCYSQNVVTNMPRYTLLLAGWEHITAKLSVPCMLPWHIKVQVNLSNIRT